MKSTVFKKAIALVAAMTLTMGALAGCGKGGSSGSSASTPASNATSQGGSAQTSTDGKPDTWIADRKVTIQAYVDDIGYALPEDTANNPVFQEIKKRTGIELEILYTPSDSDSKTLAAQLAAGTIPDMIVCYLNNSVRKEFPILYKAAKEGMFADVSEFMKNSKVYKKYMEPGYLPDDTYKNIVFREDFDGVYLMHLSIDAQDHSTEFDPNKDYVGGLMIQKKIADALGVDVKKVRTLDDFYNLLVAIKNGGFTDDNGNPVYPLGPKYWGGSVDTIDNICRPIDWGVSDGYNLDENGKVKHEIETEYAWKKVEFMRKLLAEGLMNPEFFTMDSTRSEEVSRNHNSAIMADCHNYVDLVYETNDWVPLGILNNIAGQQSKVTNGKSGYGCWAISAEAKNPEEIFKLFDYLASEEGQLLCEYGVEGLSYNMVDGKPVLTPEVQQHLDASDHEWLINNIGAGFGGAGCVFFDFMMTDIDPEVRFGESRPGSGTATVYENAVKLAKEYPVTYVLVKGLKASAFLNATEMADVKAQMSTLNYKETLVQATYADSEKEARKILDSFKKQLESAGLAQLEEYVQKVYDADHDAVQFYK